MKEVTGNLWDLPADALCITTNGFVKSNGKAVMGRGCALEAKQRYPQIDWYLGQFIKQYGNVPVCIKSNDPTPPYIFSFPVKHVWWEAADLQLIEQSARELMKILDALPQIKTILLPRPGCGNGKLKWEDVKKVIEPILDDRVMVVTFAEGKE